MKLFVAGEKGGMSVENLSHFIQVGLGRAVLLIKQHYEVAYRDVILNACLHNLAFDRQLEGSRASYMLDIIKATNDFDFYGKAVLEALSQLTSTSDEYDVEQIYDLALLFAQKGFAEAAKIISNKFSSNPALGDFAGAHALIKLNGREGFIYVAEKLSEHIYSHGEEFTVGEYNYAIDISLRFVLSEQLGEAETDRFLKQVRQSYPNTIALLDRIEQFHHPSKRERGLTEISQAYEVVKQSIEDKQKGVGFYAKWGEQAAEDDLFRAAGDLLAETDLQRLKYYLAIFRHKPFPLNYHRLFDLAQNSDQFVAVAAINALKIIDNPTIRTFALENIERGYMAGRMVELLQGSHFRDDDWPIIEPLTRSIHDLEDYHSLGFSVFAVIDRHSTPLAIPSLLNLYEHNPCSACRERVVERLYRLNAIPLWMEQECLYDSNLDLRQRMRTEFHA